MANRDDLIGTAALTRRQLLARGGFDTRRREAYVALVSCVGALPGARVDTARAHWAADRLAADYAARPPASQRAIDGVLDALDRGGFARMNDDRRVALLHSWARS